MRHRLRQIGFAVIVVTLAARGALAQRVQFPTPIQADAVGPAPSASAFTQPTTAYYQAPPPPIITPPPAQPWDPYQPAPVAPIVAPAYPAYAAPYQPLQPRGGFYGAFEGAILVARPGTFTTTIGTTVVSLNPDYNLTFSPRVIGGYKWSEGFGLRARYWHYDADGTGTVLDLGGGTTFGNLSSNIKLDVIDAEFTQDGQFSNWEFQVGAGVRLARINYTITASDPAFPGFTASLDSEFQGLGPTIAFYARRPLRGWDGFAFVTDARFSFLFGNTDLTLTVQTPGVPPPAPLVIGPLNFEDHAVTVFETRVGAEYSHCLQSGWRLTGGAYFEGQVWGWAPPFGITGRDIGFFGPTFQVGLLR